MYTSYIGKKFLKLYNQKEQQNLTARQFFDKIMFPVFFDDARHLMHVGNSPFFQKPSPKLLKTGILKQQAQLQKLHADIENEPPNMAIYVGYAAKDIDGTTSGQQTEMDIKIDQEEMYASWIGEALGIGVSGGLVILTDKEEVLYTIFCGWKHYRDYLSQTPNVKDKQIETWNGHWLCQFVNKDINSDEIPEKINFETTEVQGNLAIPTKAWSEVIFAIAKKYPAEELLVYIYNLSQTNTTLGFIKLYLPQIQRLFELRDRIFIDKNETVLNDKEISQLETFYNLRNACKIGTIGLKAMEPKGLRMYLPIGTYMYAQGKPFKTDKNSFLTNSIFKLWVIAMLNKTELLDLAERTASIILLNEKKTPKEDRGKTTNIHEANKMFESKNTKQFVESLIDLLKAQPDNSEVLKEVVKETLQMPVDNFPLFVTLIKFEYYYKKNNKEQ